MSERRQPHLDRDPRLRELLREADPVATATDLGPADAERTRRQVLDALPSRVITWRERNAWAWVLAPALLCAVVVAVSLLGRQEQRGSTPSPASAVAERMATPAARSGVEREARETPPAAAGRLRSEEIATA